MWMQNVQQRWAKGYDIFNLKVAPNRPRSWLGISTFRLKIFSFLGLICLCFEILFGQLQTIWKWKVEVNSSGPVPRAAQQTLHFSIDVQLVFFTEVWSSLPKITWREQKFDSDLPGFAQDNTWFRCHFNPINTEIELSLAFDTAGPGRLAGSFTGIQSTRIRKTSRSNIVFKIEQYMQYCAMIFCIANYPCDSASGSASTTFGPTSLGGDSE